MILIFIFFSLLSRSLICWRIEKKTKGRLKYLTLTEANRVWMPDLFFSNEKEGHFHNIIMPNVYIRIFPYGSVLYSIRISLTLACPMNLKLYPLDRQVCSLRMASCKFNITIFVIIKFRNWIFSSFFLIDRWVDNCRFSFPLERRRSSASCKKSSFAAFYTRKILNRLL